jgi:hypothetical protein
MPNEFFPYRYSDKAVDILIRDVHVDGILQAGLVNAEERLIDLVRLPTWERIDIGLSAALHPDIAGQVVPEDEAESRPWKVLLIVATRMGSTRQVGWRHSQTLTPEEPDRLNWGGHLSIRREESGAWSTMRCMVTRVSSRSAPFPGFADERALRLTGSDEWTLRIEPKAPTPGRGMKVEWIDFRTASRKVLNENDKCLYYLDLDQPQPVLFLNEGIRDLKSVLSTEGRTGSRAAIRDALFVSIAQPVWLCLAMHAASACGLEEEEPEWQRRVLEEIAPYAYRDRDEEKAVKSLRDDAANPSAKGLLLQRLGPAVQSYLQVDKPTVKLFRDIIAP